MNIRDTSKIRFCVPSKGRLNEPAVDLIRRAGYTFRLHERRLYASSSSADIIFIFARADDIPVLVDSGGGGHGYYRQRPGG